MLNLQGVWFWIMETQRLKSRNYVHLQAGPLAHCYKYGFGGLFKPFEWPYRRVTGVKTLLTWRFIPVSKWLITMVGKSPK